mmetsp:Transcript_46537/g.148540  ORF Transcript_46537/g.148540 Transcript_46537/m.148540 type:complete len:250 (+) Transcript_46537:896-1645(+)
MPGPSARRRAEKAPSAGHGRSCRLRRSAGKAAKAPLSSLQSAALGIARWPIACGVSGRSGPHARSVVVAATSTAPARLRCRQQTGGRHVTRRVRAKWHLAGSSLAVRTASTVLGGHGGNGRNAPGLVARPTSRAAGTSMCSPTPAERLPRASARSLSSAPPCHLARSTGTARCPSGVSGRIAVAIASASESATATLPNLHPAVGVRATMASSRLSLATQAWASRPPAIARTGPRRTASWASGPFGRRAR